MLMARQLYFDEKWRTASIIVGLAISFAGVAIGLIIGHYRLTSEIVPTNSSAIFTDDVIAIGILVGLSPITYISYSNYRFVRSIERNVPRFLQDILESTDSGLMLPAAIIEGCRSDYGSVSREFGIAMTKFSLGYDFGSSVLEAAQKLHHPLAQQLGLILTEAYSAGGKTHEVLNSSSILFTDAEQYDQQRSSELKPYTQLVYIAVGIYLIMAIIIITQFIAPFSSIAATLSKPISGANAVLTQNTAFNFNSVPSVSYFTSVFFLSAVVESVFAGLVAGKMVEKSSAVGLRHSILLIGFTIILFNVPILGRI
jgi:archaeal flagellar protein FlaJ